MILKYPHSDAKHDLKITNLKLWLRFELGLDSDFIQQKHSYSDKSSCALDYSMYTH